MRYRKYTGLASRREAGSEADVGKEAAGVESGRAGERVWAWPSGALL
jgi:hypothetical protein